MQKIIHSSILCAVLLSSCSSPPSKEMELQQRLKNPLFAERYAEEIVDRMVEFKIREDPILEEKEKAKIIEKTRKKWLEVGRDARKKQREGLTGFLISINEPTKGEVLYVDNTLYTDTVFTVAPGPNVHFYLTTVVDPRDVVFPDDTAIDLGQIRSAYGAQAYSVPPVEEPQLYQTVVLWDTKLELLYGFAQISE